MIDGIDTATSQRALDFGLARRVHDVCYVKQGGDNVGRYIAPWYRSQIDRCRQHDFEHTGHYWVPDSRRDPVGAADWAVDNLYDWRDGDFYVLDNEDLDGSHRYSDAQAAQFVRRIYSRLGISGKQVKVYLALSVARSTSWPKLLATGCDFIVAAYSYDPFTYDLRGKIPDARNGGHQYTSSGKIGGIITDLNKFKADAFDYTKPVTKPAEDKAEPLPVPPVPVPVPEPVKKRRSKMNIARIPNGSPDGKSNLWILFGDGQYHEFTGDTAGKAFEEQIGAPAAIVSRPWAEEQKAGQNLAALGKLPTSVEVPWAVPANVPPAPTA